MNCGASSKTLADKRTQNAARHLWHISQGEALRWLACLPRKRRSFKCRLGCSLKFSLAREERLVLSRGCGMRKRVASIEWRLAREPISAEFTRNRRQRRPTSRWVGRYKSKGRQTRTAK